MAFRFVHAADVHLDSPLKSLALRNEELGSLIGNATRRAFLRIVDLCLREQVDALLLSGDLYDGDQTSMKTALFLAAQVRRLHEASIRVFVIRGNHDALSTITRELTLPDSVHVFDEKGGVVELDPVGGGPRVAMHGLSFLRAHAPESLLPKYRQPVEGAVNVGLMHTNLDGSPHHSRYAPCSAADLHGSGIRYWALGHIHRRSVIRGDAVIVMPGMPQGRDVGEAGPKSVTMVTITDDGSIDVAEELTSVAEFAVVPVPIGDGEDWRAVVNSIMEALASEKARTASEHLVARVRVTGSSPLAWRLMREADLLRTEAEDCAARVGSCWIDKLEVACVPGQAARGPGAGIGPLAELRRLMEGRVVESVGFRTAAREILDEMVGSIPPECRRRFGTDDASVDAMVSDLSDEGVREVLGRLHAPHDGDR